MCNLYFNSSSYTSVSYSILWWIIRRNTLSYLEKIFFLYTSFISQINHKNKKGYIVDFTAKEWAKRLGCSTTKIFAMQKKLEELGYFIIIKNKNSIGQNKRNIICPTLPDSVFKHLCKVGENRHGQDLIHTPDEPKLAYLTRTKLFFPINYSLFKLINADTKLSSFSKLVIFDLLLSFHKKNMSSKKDNKSYKNSIDHIYVNYQDLASRYSKSRKYISALFNSLVERGIIQKERIHSRIIKECGERQDKSIWKISLSLPGDYIKELKDYVPQNKEGLLIKQGNLPKTNIPLSPPTNLYNSDVLEVSSSEINPQFFQSGQYYNRDIILNKNRSKKSVSDDTNSQSNLIFNNSKTKMNEYIKKYNQKSLTKSVKSRVKQLFYHKPRQLKDFHPLTEQDCQELQKKSGRDFTLNAMNEILQDMSKRLTDRSFRSKKGFISYMSKALEYEMRDAVQTSGENFKIKANQTDIEQQKAKEESYLSEIENSQQVTPEWCLKKKLANILDRSKAYKLLQGYRYLEIHQDRAVITLDKSLELTEYDKYLILESVKATHEKLNSSGEFITIHSIEFTAPQLYTNNAKISEDKKRTGLWSKIREVFIKSKGKTGEALDNHWLSKLNPDINTDSNTIQLKAPSEFTKSYIEDNLLADISYASAVNGLRLSSIDC